MLEALKPVGLVLLGLIVILGYAAVMTFGVEAIFWVALVLTPLTFVQLIIWGR